MNPVTLMDGRVVDSSSAEWRAECEARHLMALPRRAGFGADTKFPRRDYLAAVERRRGGEARRALESLGLALWEASRKKVDAPA